MNVTFDGNGLPPHYLLHFCRPQHDKHLVLVREINVDVGQWDCEHDGYLSVVDTHDGREVKKYHAWEEEKRLMINGSQVENNSELDGIKILLNQFGIEAPNRPER